MDKNITYKDINDDVVKSMLDTSKNYFVMVGVCITAIIIFWALPWSYQLYMGQGVTGLHVPSVWGIYLANFIFWIGISHSGTLLSAILYLTQTPWRRAIYRSAEAMTFFSVLTASIFIFVHMGRPWNFYWIMPYPTTRELWVNFQSPLLYDVLAVNTYMSSSALFLYLGSIPDLAAVRDRVTGWRKQVYTLLAFGWRGTDTEWFWLSKAYTFMAVLIVPLAVSVHSIVSWDFALSKVPLFANTAFPPYFVIGAIYSGTAAIITLIIVLRKTVEGVDKYVTALHFDRLNLLLVVLSLLWTYVNVLEIFTGWYANSSFENEGLIYRMFTYPWSWWFWAMIIANSVVPLFLISRKLRVSIAFSLFASLAINFGMWTERYLIVATSLPRKFLPYRWHDYSPSWVEVSMTIGSFFFFILLFLLFVKLWPSISIYEVKEDKGIPFKNPSGGGH